MAQPPQFVERLHAPGVRLPGDVGFGDEAGPKESDQKRNRR
jgi:hypothetical protein